LLDARNSFSGGMLCNCFKSRRRLEDEILVLASSVADALKVFGRNPGASCVSATPQLKRE
jgi:hypothetical protein